MAKPKIHITITGSTLVATDGINTRRVIYFTPEEAHDIEIQLNTNPDFARQWLRALIVENSNNTAIGPQKMQAPEPEIFIGARFHRSENLKLVYRVIKLADFPGAPPHVKLVSESSNRRFITIGTGVLLDRRHWIPVKADTV